MFPEKTSHSRVQRNENQEAHYQDRPKMILLVGYPGVGKSFYCTGPSYTGADDSNYNPNGSLPMGDDSCLKRDFPMLSNERNNYVIISTDEIIRDMAQNGYQDKDGHRLYLSRKPDGISIADFVYEKRRDQIRDTRDKLIQDAANQGKHIVIDALNLTNESRARKTHIGMQAETPWGTNPKYTYEAVIIHPPESMTEYTRRMESRAEERRNTTTRSKLFKLAFEFDNPHQDSNLDIVHELGKWPDLGTSVPKPQYMILQDGVAGSGIIGR